MYRFVRLTLVAAVLCGMLSTPAQAYEQQFTTEAIREAYFLGSGPNNSAAEFLSHYQRFFHPSSGATLQVGEEQVLTPYSQIVLAAEHDMVNETAVDAVQDYEHRRLPLVVRIWIYFPTGLTIGTDEYEFAKQSSVVVSEDRPLRPRQTIHHPVYTGGKYSRLIGVEIEQEFDAAQVASGDLKISVTFQDGRHFETTFDLARLK